MSSRDVQVRVGPGLVQVCIEGDHHVHAVTLSASAAEALARELLEAAAQLRANPMFQTLPENER
jgi:DNA-binding protein YbaB